ncbi:hypothetical protein C8Q79DRAFT_455112 [Trametes meyenii]|nr:hypothetical protein C8Q79DRAFT_455112 [Trametes meyenii]
MSSDALNAGQLAVNIVELGTIEVKEGQFVKFAPTREDMRRTSSTIQQPSRSGPGQSGSRSDSQRKVAKVMKPKKRPGVVTELLSDFGVPGFEHIFVAPLTSAKRIEIPSPESDPGNQGTRFVLSLDMNKDKKNNREIEEIILSWGPYVFEIGTSSTNASPQYLNNEEVYDTQLQADPKSPPREPFRFEVVSEKYMEIYKLWKPTELKPGFVWQYDKGELIPCKGLKINPPEGGRRPDIEAMPWVSAPQVTLEEMEIRRNNVPLHPAFKEPDQADPKSESKARDGWTIKVSETLKLSKELETDGRNLGWAGEGPSTNN